MGILNNEIFYFRRNENIEQVSEPARLRNSNYSRWPYWVTLSSNTPSGCCSA